MLTDCLEEFMKTYFNKVSRSDLEFFEKLLGSRNVSTSEEELVVNSIDAFQGDFYRADVVLWPETTEHVVEILRYADQHRIPVYPRGGGTGLTGTVPVYGGIVLNMLKMNKIVEVYEEDMQVTVEAGMIYEKLNKELEKYGLFFPPDPSSGSVCTIGGMVASNSSGLKAVKYGTTRDYVLGFELVFAGGRKMKLGSRTFKYSTGYDLARMMIGSQGTLGVFTEITLRLRKLPQDFKTALAFFPTVESAVKSICKIVRTGLDVAALEFVDEPLIKNISEYKKISFPESKAMVLVEAHGSARYVEDVLEGCCNIFRENDAVDIWITRDREEREFFWSARRSVYPVSLRHSRYLVISDLVVPISKLLEAVLKTYAIAEKYKIKASVIGHFGDGNIHVHWFLGDNRELLPIAHKANDELAEWVIDVGGAVSGEHGIGTEKKKFMKLQHGEAYDLMLQIKRLLDPKCILSPGVIFDVDEVIQ
ncbi:MAG: FAD-binding oxidoreductase [Nitrososphaerota archaeon]